MTLDELFVLVTPRQFLAMFVGISIVLYTVAANVAQVRFKARSGQMDKTLSSAQTTWVPRALAELARWAFYLGVPYLTLLFGFNTVRALGVWNIDWFESPTTLYYAGALTVGSIILFIWIWRPYARTEHPHAMDESRWNWARHILELIYQQAHWAFYRSGPILWLTDPYWGSFIGLALIFIEGWSNPKTRANVQTVTRADAPLWSGSLAIVSTIVFIFTQNSWYCLAIHLLLDLGLRNIIGFPSVLAPEEGHSLYLEGAPDNPE